MCLYVHACVSCGSMGLRGCTEEKTVFHKEKWPGQTVVLDQQTSPGCLGGRVGQVHVQQKAHLPGPGAVGKTCRERRYVRAMEERRACPLYQATRGNQPQVGTKGKRMAMMMMKP